MYMYSAALYLSWIHSDNELFEFSEDPVNAKSEVVLLLKLSNEWKTYSMMFWKAGTEKRESLEALEAIKVIRKPA